MGYTTEFAGFVTIDPPLNAEEIAYLQLFSCTRRMDREQGPYHAVDDGANGQSDTTGVREYNRPPAGQPGLWCGWTVTDEGDQIIWDGGEKFYDAEKWMAYLVEHFLKPGAIAASTLPFLQANHVCNGEIDAQGEESDDRWKLIVENNRVGTRHASTIFGPTDWEN